MCSVLCCVQGRRGAVCSVLCCVQGRRGARVMRETMEQWVPRERKETLEERRDRKESRESKVLAC